MAKDVGDDLFLGPWTDSSRHIVMLVALLRKVVGRQGIATPNYFVDIVEIRASSFADVKSNREVKTLAGTIVYTAKLMRQPNQRIFGSLSNGLQ